MDSKEVKSIGDRFSALLREYGMTVNAFANEVGGSTAKYYKLMNGKSKPDFDTINSVLQRFPDVSAEWFLRNEGPIRKSILISKEQAEMIVAENRAVKQMYKEELQRKSFKPDAVNPQQESFVYAGNVLTNIVTSGMKSRDIQMLAVSTPKGIFKS